MKNNISLMLGSILLSSILASCHIPKKIVTKELPNLPKTIDGTNKESADTLAIPTVDKFFQDEYLSELIDKALVHNYDLRASTERLNIAYAYYIQSRGAQLPTLMAEIFASGQRYGKYTIDGVGNFDTNLSPNIEDGQRINTSFSPNFLIGLSTQWEIDIWGRLSAMKKANWEQYLSSLSGERLIKASIITQTALHYYDLIALDKELEILQTNLQLQERAYEIVKIQKQAGRATELAVQQFSAQISKTKAASHYILQQIHERENQLQAIIGNYDLPITRSRTFNTSGLVDILQTYHPEQLIAERPDIQERYQLLNSKYHLATAARAAFFPKLAIGASAGFNAFNAEFLFNPASAVYSLLGNLSAPIFNQHQLKSQFQIANAEHELAFLDYQKTIHTAYNEVKTASNILQQYQSIIQYNKEVVTAQQRSIDIAYNLYATGYASYLEIINAQKEKLEADLNLLQAEHKEMIAFIHLYKSLGGGWK